jgi:hypothetical protein
VSERSILSLKPALRLEWRDQHGQNKPGQRDHCVNLADSIARHQRADTVFGTHRMIGLLFPQWSAFSIATQLVINAGVLIESAFRSRGRWQERWLTIAFWPSNYVGCQSAARLASVKETNQWPDIER